MWQEMLVGALAVLVIGALIYLKCYWTKKKTVPFPPPWRESGYIARVYWPEEDKFQNGVLGLEVNPKEGWWRLFQSAKFGIGEARTLNYCGNRPVIIAVLYDDIPVPGVPATYHSSTQAEGLSRVCGVMLMEAEFDVVVPNIYHQPPRLLGLANESRLAKKK